MNTMFQLVWEATQQTIVMVFLSTIFSLILGFPIGVLLHVTGSEEHGGILPHPAFYAVMSRIVNILRSFPFLILMIVLMPLSRLIIGTSIGTMATVIPLSIAAAPFVARVIESSLKEVDPGVVQAAKAMGSNLIGYSAMAGAIGGGGLGDLAIRYGYQRFRPSYMVAAVVIIIVMVELIQFIGDRISGHLISRR